MFKDSVFTAQLTHAISITKINPLMLYTTIVSVCFNTHTEHRNTLCGKKQDFLMLNTAVHKVTTGL